MTWGNTCTSLCHLKTPKNQAIVPARTEEVQYDVNVKALSLLALAGLSPAGLCVLFWTRRPANDNGKAPLWSAREGKIVGSKQ